MKAFSVCDEQPYGYKQSTYTEYLMVGIIHPIEYWSIMAGSGREEEGERERERGNAV